MSCSGEIRPTVQSTLIYELPFKEIQWQLYIGLWKVSVVQRICSMEGVLV